MIIYELCHIPIIWTKKYPDGFIGRLYYMILVLTVASYIATLIVVKIYKKSINTNLNSENSKSPDMSQKLNNGNNINN